MQKNVSRVKVPEDKSEMPRILQVPRVIRI